MKIDAKRILFIASTLIIVVFLFVFFKLLFAYTPEQEIVKLEKGWTIEIENGETLSDVSLGEASESIDRELDRGERITLRTKIPKEVSSYHSPAVLERTNYSASDIFVDGKKVLSNGKRKLANERFIGSRDLYIYLTGNEAGKELRIDLYASENGVTPDLKTPKLGNYLDLQYSFLHDHLFPLLIGIFLCIFGVFFSIVSIILAPALPELMGQLVSSILSLVFGVWVLTTFMITPVFFDSGYRGEVEYICFYLIVPLMYLLFMQIHEIRLKKLYAFLAGGSTLLIFFFIVLHFANIVHLSEMRTYYYVLSIIMMMVLIVYDIADVRAKKFGLVEVVQMLGPTLFCIFGFLAMLYYISVGFLYHKTPTEGMLLLFTIGGALFALSRFLIYFLLIAETDPRRVEFRSLINEAYSDALTGTRNRNYFDETMRTIEASDEEFALMSMDLNGLKEVNDLKGHGAGDSLLRSFASAITREAPHDAVCVRIGGDEFVMILRGGEKGKLEEAAGRIRKDMTTLDIKEPDVTHSAAYGIAYSTEFPRESEGGDARAGKNRSGIWQKVFMLADERMYEDKRRQKATLQAQA